MGGAKVVADGANKAAAAIKGGLKVNVKAPKVKVSAKAPTVKAKVGVKAAAKTRRLQEKKDAKSDTSSGFLPALPTDNKPAEKPAADANADTEMEVSKDGLPVSEYSGDVDVPKDLTGDSDQTAPKTANFVKLCWRFLAALSMM